jgi:hypothetical protein
VYGITEGVGVGTVTFVPFAELLLPSTGMVMLNLAHTWPNNVVKAVWATDQQEQLLTKAHLLATYCTSLRSDSSKPDQRKP